MIISIRSDPEGRERLLRSQITSWLTLPITRRTASSSAGGDWRGGGETDTWIPPRASGKTSPSLGAWSPAAHLLSPALQDMTLVGTPLVSWARRHFRRVEAFLDRPGFYFWNWSPRKRIKRERTKVSDPIEGRRLLLARVEWQSLKNMARSIVQIWSVTRKSIRRTRSRPQDPTRSGLKAAPTGPGKGLGLGRVGGDANAPGMSVEVGKCVHF